MLNGSHLFWLAVIVVVVVVGVATWAAATPQSITLFKLVYSPREGSDLTRANCLVCHSKMPPSKVDLNPYGKDLQKALAGKAIDEKFLRAIEKLDSDKDGVSNIDEIKAGTLPGDPKSKPAK